MDFVKITKDKRAPLTEEIPSSPLLPPIPPISLSSSPTEPAPHPQPLSPNVKSGAERQILKHVSILKREASKSTESNSWNEENEQSEGYLYLSRKLADICLKIQ